MRYEVFRDIDDAVGFYTYQTSWDDVADPGLLEARLKQLVAEHGSDSDGSEVPHLFKLLEDGLPGFSFPSVWSLPRQDEEFAKELNPFEWLSEWEYLAEGFDPRTSYDAANADHRLAAAFAIEVWNEKS